VIAAFVNPGGACVHLISVRGGRVLGSKNFFPQVGIEEEVAEVMAAFLSQYYLGNAERELPGELIVNVVHEDFAAIIEAMHDTAWPRADISHRVRGTRARWQQLAVTNAEQALGARLANRQHMAARFEALAEVLNLDEVPQRLECYDISHSSGEATVASCVVFGPEGPIKSDYRRFNIEGVTAGDDYAAMHQALTRRFSKLKDGEGKLPDILLVDGGKGQLSMARDVLRSWRYRPDPARRGQGRDPQGRFRNPVPERCRPRVHLEGRLTRAAPDPADPRRSPPFRHHRPPCPARQNPAHLDPGRRGRGRADTRRDLLKHFGGLQELSVPASTRSPKHPASVKSSPSRFMPTCIASRMPGSPRSQLCR
jgi:excinuclease ABC subunit C